VAASGERYWRDKIERQLYERGNAFGYDPYGTMDAMWEAKEVSDYSWKEISRAHQYQREMENLYRQGDLFGARQLWIVARFEFPDLPAWFFNYKAAF
jgi:hypothetical protein